MFEINTFTALLFIIGLVFAFLILFAAVKITPENVRNIEKIPRNVTLGVIFGIIDIAWCTPQAIQIFSHSSSFAIWGVAVIVLILSCIFLDYLFARALAGFLILLAHYFLRASFAVDIPVMWLFSILCLGMGVTGILFGGIPHTFRDLLRKLCVKKRWKASFIAISALYSFVMFLTCAFLIIK
ncbi:MAG: hypothetical protein K9L78_04615 [Victivallales bacterium]|nr:hypothetical protein [Victivallales bacterium]MCF7889386.1 hypothetical protein [Victivallales bacterium]